MQSGGQADGLIGKPVDFFQLDLAVVEGPFDGAAALGSQVKGEESLHHQTSITTLPTLSEYSASMAKPRGVCSRGRQCVMSESEMRPACNSAAACAPL